jgi:hypothetical protein
MQIIDNKITFLAGLVEEVPMKQCTYCGEEDHEEIINENGGICSICNKDPHQEKSKLT